MSARRPNSDARSTAAASTAIYRDLNSSNPLAVGETRVEEVSTGYRAIFNMGAPYFCVDGWGDSEAEALAVMRARVEGFEARPKDDGLIHPGSFTLGELRRAFDDDTAAEWVGV